MVGLRVLPVQSTHPLLPSILLCIACKASCPYLHDVRRPRKYMPFLLPWGTGTANNCCFAITFSIP
jgi:hypothetical protein